jgi:N-acetylglucosamine malate deacetylase 2
MTNALLKFDRLTWPDDIGADALGNLLDGKSIGWPAVVVVAHPDDETLGMGGRLATLNQLSILQLTDGAPRTGADTRGAGFRDNAHYSAQREEEARRALEVLGIAPRRVRLDASDQESIFRFSDLLSSVKQRLQRAGLVFTHPYEGGHPDHDTAALLVQAACAAIASAGGVAPVRLEFTSYHHRGGQMVTGEFWPDARHPEVAVMLDRDMHAKKLRALAEYRTQSDVIKWFCTGIERYRTAPCYDFSRPPPPGLAHYDLLGWPITASRWRDFAANALLSLQGTRN